MVAYNFQAQFASDVESGRKCQTIRANGKRKHAKRGDKLQLYTGMRTKSCRKLKDAVCYDSCPVIIEEDKVWTLQPCELHADLDGFAKKDGFASWQDMRAWFQKTHGLPFKGTLIKWLVPKCPNRFQGLDASADTALVVPAATPRPTFAQVRR